MTTALLLVLLALGAAALLVLVIERLSWLRRKTGRRVLVQTTDDQSIEGVLLRSAPDGLVLQAANLLGEGGGAVKLAGETFIPRARVRFLQLLAASPVE